MSLLLKIAMVVAVVAIALAWLKRDRIPPKAGTKSRQPDPSAVAIVACAHCGVHLPQAEACGDGGLNYCSERHRDAGPRR